MTALNQFELTWPEHFNGRGGKIEVAEQAAKQIARMCVQRRTVIQAGGCAGLWPLALAEYFEHVYTFEPADTNFVALRKNVKAKSNITPIRAALSDRRHRVSLDRPKEHAGLWHVVAGEDVQAVDLDEMFADTDIMVDAIVLDVEDYELTVLYGAERLIQRCRPVLWFEFKSGTPAIESWCVDHQYLWPQRVAGSVDAYSVPLKTGDTDGSFSATLSPELYAEPGGQHADNGHVEG